MPDQYTRPLENHSFDLAKMLAHLNNAKQLGELMLMNNNVRHKGREMVMRLNTRINATISEILHSPALSREAVQILRRDMVNDEVTAQIEMITTQLLALPKGTRDEIESYVNSRYNTYRLNK